MKIKINRKAVFIALVALAAVLALSACGSKNESNNTASAPASASASAPASSSAAASGETKEITITASNWKFDQTEIKAHKGDTIKLSLKNESGLHSVAFDDFGIEIKAGETKEFTVKDAGTFEFHCNTQCGQGHDNMSGSLIVE